MQTGSYSTVREPSEGVTLPRTIFFILTCLLLILTILVIALPLAIYLNEEDCDSSNSNVTTVIPSVPTGAPQVNKTDDFVVPSHYELDLQVYIPQDNTQVISSNSMYNGTVKITVFWVHMSKTLLLDAANSLTVNPTVTVVDLVDSSSLGVSRIDHTSNILQIRLIDSPQIRRQYLVTLMFSSNLSTRLDGFFVSSYEENGVKKSLAATQLQPQSARKLFPCFDKPSLKATFSVSVTHLSEMTALSNTEQINVQTTGDNLKRTSFEVSPRMSTYLLAIFVSKYSSRNTRSDKGTLISVWAPESQLVRSEFALNIAPKILNFYESWFKYPYPLTKLDLVALPDFDSGGMENWGLVIFKDSFLLGVHREDSVDHERDIAIIISHELAHQWFGNLVTMESWEDLWLNEGFANYMQYLGVDNVTNGSLDMSTQFVSETMHRALYLDSLQSHPLHTPLKGGDEPIFDAITYDKGASMIHMLESVIGTDALHSGLTNYIALYQYNNANEKDLWTALSQSAAQTGTTDWNGNPLNLTQFMYCWTRRAGYPLVTVTRDYDRNTVTAHAEQFSLMNTDSVMTPVNICPGGWYIPLWYKEQSQPIKMVWLTPNHTISWGFQTPSTSYLVVNPEAKGYYRVNYDIQNWRYILDIFNTNHTTLDVKSRTQILNDLFNLAKVGKVEYSIVLSLSKYLQKEEHYSPWFIAAEYLFTQLPNLMTSDVILPKYQEYLRKIIRPVYHSIDFVNSLDTKLQLNQQFMSLIYWHSCGLDDVNCVSLAKYYLDDLKTHCNQPQAGTSGSCNRVPANLRQSVYSTGVRTGTKNDWEYMWNAMINEPSPNERQILWKALGAASANDIIQNYASRLLDSSKLQQSEIPLALSSLAKASSLGLNTVWMILQQQFDTIFQRFGKSDALALLLTTVINELYTEDHLREANAFITGHKIQLGDAFIDVLQENLINVQSNIRWRKLYLPVVRNWLDTNNN